MRRIDPVLEYALKAGVSASVLAGTTALSPALLGVGVALMSWAGLKGLDSWRRQLNKQAYLDLLEDTHE